MTKRRKIALFGGSFNPPHISHQMICLYLLDYLNFSKVFLIPTYKHPFSKELVSFDDRVAMCRRMANILGFSRIAVLPLECTLFTEQRSKSYTIDTIKHLIKSYPDVDFTLVIGADVTHELHKWKDFDHIKQLVDLVVFTRQKERGGYSCADGFAKYMKVFDKPEVSSTDVRAVIAENKFPEGWISISVWEYIEKNKLYGAK